MPKLQCLQLVPARRASLGIFVLRGTDGEQQYGQ